MLLIQKIIIHYSLQINDQLILPNLLPDIILHYCFKIYYSNRNFRVNAYNSCRPNTRLGVDYTFKSLCKFLFLSNMKTNNIPNYTSHRNKHHTLCYSYKKKIIHYSLQINQLILSNFLPNILH